MAEFQAFHHANSSQREKEYVMIKFYDMLDKQMQDDEFRKEYEALQPEMDAIREIVDSRNSQNLSKKELDISIKHRIY